MSGQWELVTKKKDKGSKLPVPKVNHDKDQKNNNKNVLNGIKLEEVLPKSQVQNLYGTNKSKENKVPDKNKPKETTKKPQKKDKPSEQPKSKPPKSIQSALLSIDLLDLNDNYEKVKACFPDAPIVWLKELVQILNQKIPIADIQDPIFTSKSINYPLNVVPSGLTSLLEKAINEAGKNNSKLFFDICLTAMATDMNKGLPVIGYKIVLQFIALQEPNLIVVDMEKYVALRNSYQNRPNIGLSILWAVSHVGYKDFHSGLLVFNELFLPLLDMKNYSRYILSYLINIIKANNNTKSISIEELLSILNIVYGNKKNMPNDLIKELSVKISDLKSILSIKSTDFQLVIDLLLKQLVLNSNGNYRNYLCDLLLEMFFKNQTNFLVWSSIYAKNLSASALFLEYISNNWSNISKKINKTAFKKLLSNLNSINMELSLKKRKEEALKQSISIIQKLEEKMVAKKKGWFPVKTVFVLLFIVSGLIFYDIKTRGSWEESLTKKTLKDYKVCEYSHVVIDRVKYGFQWSSERIEEQFPGLQKTIVVFSEPYVELSINLYKILRNVVGSIKNNILEKYPLLIQSVEAYLPGLIENSQKAFNDVYLTSILYFNRGVDYLKNEIFVGKFSPENMQRVVIEAFNTTQHKATEYYHWIYNKVQTSIK